MKLKEFNADNTHTLRKGTPAIGVNQKTGLFNLNKDAVEKLNLSSGGQLIIHQDEDAKENWYIEVVKKNGFAVRCKGKISLAFFNNCTLARAIAESTGIDGSFRLLIAGEPTKFEKRTLWGLLIRSTSK